MNRRLPLPPKPVFHYGGGRHYNPDADRRPTMTREEIQAKTRTLIAEHLEVAEAKVTETADLTTQLGADSLDLVEIVILVEDAFDLSIPDTDVQTVTQNLRGAVDYIVKRLA